MFVGISCNIPTAWACAQSPVLTFALRVNGVSLSGLEGPLVCEARLF